MRVALVNRRFTEHGGTERFMVGLARFLKGRGHEVHVHSSEVDPGLRDPGLHFHPLPLLRPAKNLGQWWRSASIDGDVVMALGRCRGHDVARAGGGAHAAWQRVCRPSWPIEPGQWVERAVDRHTLRSARFVITPSEAAAQDIVDSYAVPRGRIRVVPNGVDCERFQPGPGGEGLLFVGTGFVRKGLAEAIAVAEALSLPLTVLGGDGRLARWKARHPSVRFEGVVPDPERWMGRFDALLLPTLYEPYGNVCLEAMACGTPALTTPVNGVTEVLPGDFVAQGGSALIAATEGALSGGTSLRERCRQLAVAQPPSRAYQAVEQILQESAR